MALQKIGALWLKDGKKGKFMSGEIEINGVKTKILVFKNSKQKDTHPDYQIQMPLDDNQDQPQQPGPGSANQHGQSYYSEQGGNQSPPPFDDSDIPF